jgi:hypothetical protein
MNGCIITLVSQNADLMVTPLAQAPRSVLLLRQASVEKNRSEALLAIHRQYWFYKSLSAVDVYTGSNEFIPTK